MADVQLVPHSLAVVFYLGEQLALRGVVQVQLALDLVAQVVL